MRHEAGGSDPDCDYHIEIGPKDPAMPRAIVEVTKDSCELQKRIFEY